MPKDYYAILNVDRFSPNSVINAAFRKLAVENHPKKNPKLLAQFNFVLSQLCEAFEFVTARLRETFDKFGEEVLKGGIPDGQSGKFRAGYVFSGDTDGIFEKFFGTANPFAVQLEEDLSVFIPKSKEFGSVFRNAFYKKLTDVNLQAKLTLEECFFGCKKEASYERLTLMGDGKQEKYQVFAKEFVVKPGTYPGTILKYPGDGNMRFGFKTSDLIIQIIEVPHPLFRRVGKDLVYVHTISLQQALNSEPVEFKTINNEIVKVVVDEVITPQTEYVVKGKGMPILDDDPLSPVRLDYGRGDIIVKFNIIFPDFLDQAQKDDINSILDEND